MNTITLHTISRADRSDALELDVPVGTWMHFAETVNAGAVAENTEDGELAGVMDPGTVLVCMALDTDPAATFHERMELADAPALTDWERDLLALAPTLPSLCANPYSDCNGVYLTHDDGLIECERCGYTPNGADYV
jgi:hypothetical protein